MLTLEKDEKAEQVFIHASPEKLRWLASRLEAIAAQAEKSGNSIMGQTQINCLHCAI
ncbi:MULTISPECIES: hypothetical protein [Pseudoalteromonas]|uniref:Uncharacterized protein n=1 Tax=Pseudoalteromonas obscura TaxID=3048491 RepID=A0ABT7EE92_9GAMM|nr:MULTISPECIES: hypothetical protein [Pseudoalteromonas]MBQ4838544.1 hypothetical protein [Pseudoalteromonas luteoviolacea]MDK2593587.1 hypothetical protein [Pseudoalteromonas sp. P94(2023)]